ncbi:MAG: gliding motility-associated C-terminal domain-containing protein, partial [Taibaiella sp.]|nr:gliding motility-associated C-terminal domain-containing protein [Taibaiella sp.]
TYTWSPTAGLSCNNCPSPIANPASTTVYTVTGVDSIGCKATDNVTVTVNPLPAINAGEDVTACEGVPVQLNATGGVNYTWLPAAGLSCTNCPDPVATLNNTTTYTVNGTDANGCTNIDAVTVNIINRQEVSYSRDDSICIGEEIELFATGGTHYTWSPADNLSNAGGANTKASPASTTQYRVIIKQGDCFIDTGYATIFVFGPPEINAGPDQHLQGGNEVRLETRSSNVATYEWTPADGLSCTGCANPVASPRRTTTYLVRVASAQGCTAEDDVTVYITCSGDQLFIANTFTPNNDGVNDLFFPQGKGLTTVQRFSVYSRWGELLFDRQNIPLNDATYGWDGTYKSEPLKPDVFVYVVRAVCEDGQPIEIKGDISLIR